jgi:hypothetical protein
MAWDAKAESMNVGMCMDAQVMMLSCHNVPISASRSVRIGISPAPALGVLATGMYFLSAFPPRRTYKTIMKSRSLSSLTRKEETVIFPSYNIGHYNTWTTLSCYMLSSSTHMPAHPAIRKVKHSPLWLDSGKPRSCRDG